MYRFEVEMKRLASELKIWARLSTSQIPSSSTFLPPLREGLEFLQSYEEY